MRLKMPVTEEQLKKIKDWMASKGVNNICHSCKRGNNWTVGEIITTGTITPLMLGGPTIPMVQVICNNCGFVKLFAARPLGLI